MSLNSKLDNAFDYSGVISAIPLP